MLTSGVVLGAGLAQLVSEQFASAEDKQAANKGKQDANREYMSPYLTHTKLQGSSGEYTKVHPPEPKAAILVCQYNSLILINSALSMSSRCHESL